MLKFFKDKQNILIFILFFTFWFAVAFVTKSMFSGFHLIDDHNIFSLHEQLVKNGFWSTFHDYYAGDFHVRFKPLIYFLYMLKVKFFGLNYILWSVYTTSLGIFSSYFLYLTSKKLGFNIIESIIVPAVSFVGYQSLIWFHLGYDETQGMFLFSLSLLFLVSSILDQEKTKLKNVLFILFYALTLLAKETFIITIPAVLFLRLYLFKQKNQTSLKEVLIKNKISSICWLLIMITLLVIIKLVIGTKNGYTGVEVFNLSQYYSTFMQLNIYFPVLRILSIVIFVLFLFNKNKTEVIKNLNPVFPYLILFFLIIIPQICVYTKSGFYPRYLLPVSLGFAFLVASLFKFIKTNFSNKSFITSSIILFLLLSSMVTKCYAMIRDYAREGHSVQYVLNNIKQKTKPSSNILVVADITNDYERPVGFQKFLNQINRKNILFFPITQRNINTLTTVEKDLINNFIQREKCDFNPIIKKYDAIILFSSVEKPFNNAFKEDLKKYKKTKDTFFTLYNKK